MKQWVVKNRKLFILVALAVLVKLISLRPDWVERYYANGLYLFIARLQRMLLGWLPLSLGDLVYGFMAGYIIYKTARFVRRLLKRQFTRGYIITQLRALAVFSLWVYLAFNLLWGLNYNRKGIAWQLDLDVKPYSSSDLVEVIDQLKQKLAATADTTGHMQELTQKSKLMAGAVEAFQAAAVQYPFLHMKTRSVKPSLFSYLGNYLGFMGYYNPFTGEAQVNTTVPVFLQPNITCHEIAHQAGYAKENEANFVGYLAAKNSPDRRFRYSAYLDLLQYAALELRFRDSTLAKATLQGLHPQVVSDIAEFRRFRLAHQNPLERVVMWWYGHYLRANSMPNGVATYNEVVAWLVAYYKKQGAAAL